MPAMVQCAHSWAVQLMQERDYMLLRAGQAPTDRERSTRTERAELLHGMVVRATRVCEQHAREAAMSN